MENREQRTWLPCRRNGWYQHCNAAQTTPQRWAKRKEWCLNIAPTRDFWDFVYAIILCRGWENTDVKQNMIFSIISGYSCPQTVCMCLIHSAFSFICCYRNYEQILEKNAMQTSAKVVSWRRRDSSHHNVWFRVHNARHFILEEGWERMKWKEPGRQKLHRENFSSGL